MAQRVAALLLLVCLGVARSAPEPARPNVVWITCEDMSPNLRCFGDAHAVTPNLDRLATQGVRYTRAHSVAGVCAPSRSCLITGLYPSSLGTHHMRCNGQLPASVKCFTENLRAGHYYCTNNVKTDYNFPVPVGAWDESSNRAHWRKRTPGQPFFSVFNFTSTHESQIRVAEPAFRRHLSRLPKVPHTDPTALTMPPYYPDTPVVRRDWQRYQQLISVMDTQVGAVLTELELDGLADDTIVFFFSDHGVGLPRGKRWLYEAGIHVPLIVRFGRNWAHLAPAKAGETIDHPVSFVDFAATVLSLAEVPIPPTMQGTPFLGKKRASRPRQFYHGIRDRMDERYDLTRSVSDGQFKFIRNYLPHLPWAQPISYMEEMPTMQEWRRLAAAGKLQGPSTTFLSPSKPFEELYDLTKDPHETVNLANDPAYQQQFERLRSEHRRWVIETRDLGLLTEAEMHERAAGSAPYDMARSARTIYPIEEVLHAAECWHGKHDPLPTLLRLAAHKDSAVRYWAMVGLGVCGRESEQARKALRIGLKDDSPSVRVAAADGLKQQGLHVEANPVLQTALNDSNPWVRVHVINVWSRFTDKDPLPASLLSAASKDKNEYVRRVAEYHAGKSGESRMK